MGAERGPQRLVAAFADEVHVDLAQGGQETVGVVDRDRLALVGDLEPVVRHVARVLRGQGADPDAVVLMGQFRASRAGDDDDGAGETPQCPDGDDAVLAEVRAEDGVRLVVDTLRHLLEGGGIDTHGLDDRRWSAGGRRGWRGWRVAGLLRLLGDTRRRILGLVRDGLRGAGDGLRGLGGLRGQVLATGALLGACLLRGFHVSRCSVRAGLCTQGASDVADGHLDPVRPVADFVDHFVEGLVKPECSEQGAVGLDGRTALQRIPLEEGVPCGVGPLLGLERFGGPDGGRPAGGGRVLE